MKRIVYETNIGRWPLMTRKWPAKQRIKTCEYLASRLRLVRGRYRVSCQHTYVGWHANETIVALPEWSARESATQMERIVTRRVISW